MKLGVYAIFDRLAEESGPLFTAKNDAVAVRSFRIATAESKAEEHMLYIVGEYDTDQVSVSSVDKREIVVAVRQVGDA
ncbi:MAG: nonstructural protein [Microvirus sp.]|nr:MAG: nonstructural protein [Microvirus sp.]